MIESKWLSLYVSVGVIVLLTIYLINLYRKGKEKIKLYEIFMFAILTPFWPVFIAILIYPMIDDYFIDCRINGKTSWWIRFLNREFNL